MLPCLQILERKNQKALWSVESSKIKSILLCNSKIIFFILSDISQVEKLFELKLCVMNLFILSIKYQFAGYYKENSIYCDSKK